MSNKWTTLTEFILKEEQQFPDAQGNLTLLLNQIAEAGKIIASHIKKSGLVDIQGSAGRTNTSSEEVQKLDEFANDLMVDILKESGQVATIVSEEMEDSYEVETRRGDYIVYMDPLDGSTNIDVNVSIGTIFSIYKKSGNTVLYPGRKQVAAGYILYGSSVMFIYTCGAGVNGFTLDPSIGSFLLSHPGIKIPDEGHIYSINEGYSARYSADLQKYLEAIKNEENPYKARYVGSMVADIHRTLLKGGIFIYPADSKNPEGKLRLMLEVNSLAYIVEQAGGTSISGKQSPLDISPSDFHQRVPVVMGSKKEVEKYQQTVI